MIQHIYILVSRTLQKLIFFGLILLLSQSAIAEEHELSPQSNYENGVLEYRSKDWIKAIDSLKNVLKEQPGNVDARLFLGLSYLKRYQTDSELEESKLLFETVISKHPEYVDAHKGLKQIEILNNPSENGEERKKNDTQVEEIHDDKDLLMELSIYRNLSKSYLESPEYLYTLGNIYSELGASDLALNSYRNAYGLQPDNADIDVKLAYSLIHHYQSQIDLKWSIIEFKRVLDDVPDYQDAKDALLQARSLLHSATQYQTKNPRLTKTTPRYLPEYYYQLGNIYDHLDLSSSAITAYKRGLQLQPENPDMHLKLGLSLIRSYSSQSELEQAREEFKKVLQLFPNYEDAKQGLFRIDKILHQPEEESKERLERERKLKKGARNEALEEVGKHLLTQDDNLGAIQVFIKLTQEVPSNSDYYYYLGNAYAHLERHDEAIDAYNKAIELTPDQSDALNGLANQNLFLKHYNEALALFARALETSPNNTDTLFGLARTEALLKNPIMAEEYYRLALTLSHEDKDILHSYASFLLTNRRYEESLTAFRALHDVTNEPNVDRYILFDLLAFTNPSFLGIGGIAKEKEKDQVTGRWVASISYLNAEAWGIYPITDQLRFSVRARTGKTTQDLLVSNITQFGVKSTSIGVRGEYIFDPSWSCLADVSLELISNNAKCPTLPTKSGVKLEPTFVVRYVTDLDNISFGEICDSVIYRDFNLNHVRVVTRETALITYQHNFENRRQFGADAAWLWYQDPVHNQEQIFNAWVQTGLPALCIPYFLDTLSLRYQCSFLQFNHIVTGYYSFQYQLTHWIRLNYLKQWQNGIHCNLEYWYGWRTTRGINPQEQIVVSPVPLTGNTTIHIAINQAFATLGYTAAENCDLSLVGFYYHDSTDYIAQGMKFLIGWHF